MSSTTLMAQVMALVCLAGLGWASFAPVTNPILYCPALPPHNATVIQDLRPMDIKVVMALGDSILAGLAIMGRNTDDIFNEYRGLSAVMGADDGATSHFNFFKHYRPDVVGGSTGAHFWQLPGMPYRDSDQLNAAFSDASSINLITQIDHLVQKMSSNSAIDMANDWKLLTLLIGANDACGLCWDINPPSIESAGDTYEQNLRKAIESAYERIPRLFISILPMFNISQVYYLSLTDPYCTTFHEFLPVECPCAFDSSEQRRQYLDSVVGEYNKRIYKIYNEWKVKNSTTFALQIQPFTQNLLVPSLHPYISDLDCFHPSLYTHERIAVASWNSLLTPWKLKPQTWNPDAPILCPDEHTRLYLD